MNFSAILGGAGSGKTTLMRERAQASGESIKLTATTGIASVNLGPSVTTINSALGFYDVTSLMAALKSGKLLRRLREVCQMHKTLAIDEVSMLPANVLDCLIDCFLEIEATARIEVPDLLVIGDFLQLPPVTGNFAFEGKHWEKFSDNTTTLTGSYRQQEDTRFFVALQAARAGRGVDCVHQLRNAGITYRTTVDDAFDGLTVTPLNASVDKINRERYAKVSGVEQEYKARLWGVTQSDWSNIPARVLLKKGLRVMILANYKDRDTGELEFVNGDSGVVEELGLSTVVIKLDRNGETVSVPFVMRRKLVPEKGSYSNAEWVGRENAWMIGSLAYLPVRLAYASSIHKSQGLTLNKVQIDTRTRFAGEPGMMYTALSRCRGANDVVIVTKSAGDFARRIQTHPKVKCWI